MYVIKFRKPGQWFWRTLKLKSQVYAGDRDKLVCQLSDGTFHEIPNISTCEFRYGIDMINALKGAKTDASNVPNPQGADIV